jgi:hypothetical protein
MKNTHYLGGCVFFVLELGIIPSTYLKDLSMEYEAVIGLETHIQLNTQTKIFCANA